MPLGDGGRLIQSSQGNDRDAQRVEVAAVHIDDQRIAIDRQQDGAFQGLDGRRRSCAERPDSSGQRQQLGWDGSLAGSNLMSCGCNPAPEQPV